MIRENWGTSGTAGDYDWQFADCSSVTLGTYDGNVVLVLQGSNYAADGNKNRGSCYFPVTTYKTSGSFWASVYDDYLQTSKETYTCFLVGDEGNGTTLWVRSKLWSSVTISFWKRTSAGSTLVDNTQISSPTNVDSWAYLSVVQSGGTLYGTLTFDGTVATADADGWTFPDAITPTIIDRSESNTPSPINIVQWPYDRRTILDYDGTYNDGSTAGGYNFGDYVISMGDVSQVGYIPYVNQGWSSSLNVKIDDSTGIWSDFVGDMDNPTWTGGTFTARQYWGSWTNLLTCTADANDVEYDYGEKIVTLTLHDILARMAEKSLPLDGSSDASDLTKQIEFGTVLSISSDRRSIIMSAPAGAGGVVYTPGSVDGPWFCKDDIVWSEAGTGGNRVYVGTALNYTTYGEGTWLNTGGGSYYGTFGCVGTAPSWMRQGDVLWISQRYPSRNFQENAFPSYESGDFLDEVATAWGFSLTSADVANANYYEMQWGKAYHPGDKYKDIMNDVCASCRTTYAIDGDGDMIIYTDGPWSGSVTGTFDFNLSLNNQWSLTYVPATKKVIVKSGWNENEEDWTQIHESTEGTFDDGDVLTIEAGWLRDPTDGAALAQRTAFDRGITRTAFSVQVEGSLFNTYIPRRVYSVSNLPAAFAVPSEVSQWRLMGKTYNYNEDLTTLTWESKRINRDWWIWDTSTWDGGDVWW